MPPTTTQRPPAPRNRPPRTLPPVEQKPPATTKPDDHQKPSPRHRPKNKLPPLKTDSSPNSAAPAKKDPHQNVLLLKIAALTSRAETTQRHELAAVERSEFNAIYRDFFKKFAVLRAEQQAHRPKGAGAALTLTAKDAEAFTSVSHRKQKQSTTVYGQLHKLPKLQQLAKAHYDRPHPKDSLVCVLPPLPSYDLRLLCVQESAGRRTVEQREGAMRELLIRTLVHGMQEAAKRARSRRMAVKAAANTAGLLVPFDEEEALRKSPVPGSKLPVKKAPKAKKSTKVSKTQPHNEDKPVALQLVAQLLEEQNKEFTAVGVLMSLWDTSAFGSSLALQYVSNDASRCSALWLLAEIDAERHEDLARQEEGTSSEFPTALSLLYRLAYENEHDELSTVLAETSEHPTALSLLRSLTSEGSPLRFAIEDDEESDGQPTTALDILVSLAEPGTALHIFGQ